MKDITESLPRVTILMADSGGGHRAAAQSLTDALQDRALVTWLNLLDEHTPFPLNKVSDLYGPLVTRAPRLYYLLYRYASARSRIALTERAIYPLVRRSLTSPLLSQKADLVISVHPLHNNVPLRILRSTGLNTPFVTVVTDPITAPAAWFCSDVDLCIVASEQARETALACGLAAQQVCVIGLPIRRAFLAARDRPKPTARALVGLPAEQPLVLMTGGGAGIGRLLPIAQALAGRLADHPAQPQLAIIAGRNRELQQRLAAEPWPLPVHVTGYVENMSDWLAAADLLVTKAGPGTLAEAACLSLPTLITEYIPGQEEGNVAWITQNGAGAYETNPASIAGLAADLLLPGNPALGEMAAHARALGQPDAAAEIARVALGLIGSSPRNRVGPGRI